MLPKSTQPAGLFGTATAHRFDLRDIVTNEQLKFRPIIVQTGTYTYYAA